MNSKPDFVKCFQLEKYLCDRLNALKVSVVNLLTKVKLFFDIFAEGGIKRPIKCYEHFNLSTLALIISS